MPSWSPDGGHLAFVAGSGGDSQIATMRSDGSDRRVISHAHPRALRPAWSPDGSRIAYVVIADNEDRTCGWWRPTGLARVG